MNDSQPPIDQGFSFPVVRRVGLNRPLAWLKSSWLDVRANPVTSMSYGLLFALAGALVLIFSWSRPYLFTAAVSGFILIAPLLHFTQDGHINICQGRYFTQRQLLFIA